jgi:hypothetical protein
MRTIASLASILLVAASLLAAPNREPLGNTEPEALPAIDLNSLKPDAGVAFGDWAVWRYDSGGESYFLINRKTNLIVYVYWGSNGWVNFRKSDGTWHVLFPGAGPELQDRRDLNVAPFVGKQPTVRVAPGKYTVKNWTITVTGDTMEFFTPNVKSHMSIRVSSGDFVHNDRTITGR